MIAEPVRHAAETTAGAVVASSWFWLDNLHGVVAALASVAGLVYMLLKIWQVIRELRKPVGGIEPLRSVLLPWAVAMLLAGNALAHDPNDDPEIAAWMRGLISPLTGGSCCSERDCSATDYRPTRNGLEAMSPVGTWIEIPPETVLRGIPNPTGRGVLCWNGTVLCFVEATGV